jgi:hypothetical protein
VAAVVGVGVGGDLAEPRPVVEAWAFRPGSRAAALPRRRGKPGGDPVSALADLPAVEWDQVAA